MGFFGDIGLAYEFSIALGGLIAVTFVAALVRLYWKKRKLAKATLKQDLEAAEKATHTAITVERVFGEDDLFGVRAIEKGFYGGVTQSTSTRAANSPRLSPTVAASDGSPMTDSTSAGSNIHDELLLSGTAELCAPSHTKSLSLRLQPSDVELTGRRNHDLSVAMSAYIPSYPSGAKVSSEAQSKVNNIPTSPTTLPQRLNNQVQSYAQWRISEVAKGTPQVVPRPEYQTPKPDTRISRPSTRNSGIGSQPGSLFINRGPNFDPSTDRRSNRRKSRSVSSLSDDPSMEAPKVPDYLLMPLTPPPIPLRNPSRQSQSVDANLDSENREENKLNGITLISSRSLRDSGMEFLSRSSKRLSRSQKIEVQKGHASTASTKNLRHVRDSLRHNRKSSSDSVEIKRQSRKRDTTKYDPEPRQRSNSGVVVGRNIEFDKRRTPHYDDSGNSSPENSPESSSSGSNSRSRSRSDGDKSKVISLEYTNWMKKQGFSNGGVDRRS